jgi:hypothetical protein
MIYTTSTCRKDSIKIQSRCNIGRGAVLGRDGRITKGSLTMFLRPRSWLPQPIIALWDAIRFDVLTGWGQFWQRPHDGGSFDHLQVGSYDSRFAGFLNADH